MSVVLISTCSVYHTFRALKVNETPLHLSAFANAYDSMDFRLVAVADFKAQRLEKASFFSGN